MKLTKHMTGLALVAGVLPLSGVTLEELAARMEVLEKKVEAYESRYGPLENGGPLPETMRGPAPVPQLAPKGGIAGDVSDLDASYGIGGSGSGGASWAERTSLGGYGEMHLSLGDKEEIDFHRWVLFLNHRFTDRIKLFSELELEHSLSGDGKPGEVELEQAYIEFDMGRNIFAKAGLFLLPVGSLNEVHEPNTFYGTERNPIEREIIPTTWWEGGVGLTQSTDHGFQWDLALHSGLDVPTTGNNAYRIRSGRGKVAEAPARSPAVTGRLRYTGLPGLDLSVFGQYQDDITQEDGDEDNSAVFVGASATYQRGGFGLKGLVGHWDIDGPTPARLGRDSQTGYFIEPSYSWMLGQNSRVGVFTRYNHYEYARGTVDQIDAGLNFWPIDNVVLKADYSHIDKDGSPTEDIFNLGVGYSF